MTIKNDNGLSYFLILLTGIVLAAAMATALVVFKQFDSFNSPHTDTIFKFINNGKLDGALNLVEKLPQNHSQKFLLKGKILALKAMDIRNKERWIHYGDDPDDWFKDEFVDSAIVYLNEVAQENDHYASDAHFMLGVIYKEKGWFQMSETEFKAALSKDSSNTNVRLGLAALYVSQEKFNDAEIHLQNAYSKDTANPLISKNMAFLYKYYLYKPESSLVWFNRFLKSAPRKDLDVNLAKNECKEIADRYPEYVPSGPQYWLDPQPKFKARKIGE